MRSPDVFIAKKSLDDIESLTGIKSSEYTSDTALRYIDLASSSISSDSKYNTYFTIKRKIGKTDNRIDPPKQETTVNISKVEPFINETEQKQEAAEVIWQSISTHVHILVIIIRR